MRVLALSTAAFLLVGAGGAQEPVKKEMAQFQGEWSMLHGETEGQTLPERFVKGSKRIVLGDVTTVIIGERPYMKAKFTVDPTKKPKTIDYVLLEGSNKGKTQLGVYELEGDSMKICFAAPGKERPTEFKAEEGSGRTLSTWKRDRK